MISKLLRSSRRNFLKHQRVKAERQRIIMGLSPCSPYSASLRGTGGSRSELRPAARYNRSSINLDLVDATWLMGQAREVGPGVSRTHSDHGLPLTWCLSREAEDPDNSHYLPIGLSPYLRRTSSKASANNACRLTPFLRAHVCNANDISGEK